MNLYDIIRRPLDTEKFDRARDQYNQYAFEVDKKATKLDVKQAVESIFKVKVTSVQTQILRGKNARVTQSAAHSGRRPNWKRAIVTLKEGDAISLFEGK
jgi:large subunit ribosomal protein L23